MTQQLTFDFEDKLKKFIEENCDYNFEITINKTNAGVEIKDSKEIRTEDIRRELENIYSLVSDIYQEDNEIYGTEELEDAIDNLLEKL